MENQIQPKFDKVMIIDDSAFDVYITARLMHSNHFSKTVLEYNDGASALAYLQENQHNLENIPQIIFVDIYMPLMDGFEFVEHFKMLSTTVMEKCKVVMVSSTIDERDISRAKLNEAISKFTIKPITKKFFDALLVH